MINDNKRDYINKFEYIKDWTIHRERNEEGQKLTWDNCPEPYNDEILSSYFTRATKANYAELISALRILERISIVTNRYDIDRNIKRETIQKIAKLLNQNEDYLIKMCLFTKSQNYRDKFMIKGASFCPHCLKEDNIPYFRLDWRLNFITICPIHKCYLLDKCPNCNSDIRYWDTKFNQSIIECYKCKMDLSKSKSQEINENIYQINSFINFQNTLVNAYKTLIWDNKPIVKERFFLGIWKITYSEYIFEMRESNQDYENDLYNYIRNIQGKSEAVFPLIYSTSQIMKKNPNRLSKPFICPVDGKSFSNLVFYLRHALIHDDIACPFEDCKRKSQLIVFKNHLKCYSCGTRFKRDGTIIFKGRKMICPMKECRSVSIMVREENVLCWICGTIFDENGKIIKKGYKLKCPSAECRSKNVRFFNNNYKCYTCGTEFDYKGSIINLKVRMICPLRDCHSKEIRMRSNGYKCEKCGTLFNNDGEISQIGRVVKNICPLKGCGSKSIRTYDNHLSCYHCGTKFDLKGEILKKGKRLRCPLKECQSTWIRTNQTQENLIICRKCGTEFNRKSKILKKGKLMVCPNCTSKRVRADVNNYHCERCGMKFDVNSQTIEKGITLKCPMEKCGSKILQIRKTDSYIICKKCGTKFTKEGDIIRFGKKVTCPICTSNSTSYNLQDRENDEFFCRKCGSKFTFSNRILSRGIKKDCPRCQSRDTWYVPSKKNYRCNKCKVRFF